MSSPTRFHQGFITLVLMAILTPHALCKAVKTSARPVHEVINEQSRIDSRTSKTSGFLPYGNPLADNSKQSAILHAANQQAMFHAERVRQHRAQVQRWTKAPIQMDSYMKAYHDSQEKHQIALEQQQTKADAFTPMTPPTVSKSPVRLSRAESKRVIKVLPRPEPTKMTKIEPAPKPNKIRSHRSFGSLNHQYASPKRLQTVYLSPGTTYDQGVTIKPHGNVGLSPFKPSPQSEANTLYTEAIPSHTQYVYPKQYNQMQNYQSAQEIDTLNSLLKIPAHDQLSHLNALIQSSKDGSSLDEGNKDAAIDSPIDLYFYLKDPPASKTLVQHFDQANYAQLPQNYASSYINEAAQPNDHKPIMEDVQDIPDPNVHTKGKNYGLQPVVNDPKIMETTTTKSNNYYKVEVASQTISSGYKSPYYGHDKQPTQYYLSEQGEENKPSYEALKYSSHPSYYEAQDSKLEGDQSERYLHHNAQHLGVQHLNVDGTGVSAYGDEGNLHYAANYEFGYRVKDQHTGNDFGHHEAKEGDSTNGQYHVLLPDGRMQKVQYSAGPEGFHADISYDHLQQQY